MLACMTQTTTPEAALRAAVELLGSQAAMARLCGVSQPAVFLWLKKPSGPPAEHVLKIEFATGVSRHDLRPDIYPRELSGIRSDGAPPADPTAPAGGASGAQGEAA